MFTLVYNLLKTELKGFVIPSYIKGKCPPNKKNREIFSLVYQNPDYGHCIFGYFIKAKSHFSITLVDVNGNAFKGDFYTFKFTVEEDLDKAYKRLSDIHKMSYELRKEALFRFINETEQLNCSSEVRMPAEADTLLSESKPLVSIDVHSSPLNQDFDMFRRSYNCFFSNMVTTICQVNKTSDVSAQDIANRIIKLFMDRTNSLVELYKELVAN